MKLNCKIMYLLFVPMFAMAEIPNMKDTTQEIKEPVNVSELISPMPDDGVKIIPLAKMNLPESLKQDILNRLAQQKLKGYYTSNTPYVQELLSAKSDAIKEIKITAYKNNLGDGHFKEFASDIKLAFAFDKLKMIKRENIIGFVPTGTWIKNGWTGISEFFTDDKLGTCHFVLNNMPMTHGASFISTEAARHDINKKPNTLNVEGNEKSGFLYGISWYNDNFNKYLECANMKYDSTITIRLIELAREIDKSDFN